MQQNAFHYQKVDVSTASRGKLLLILIDHTLRELRRARTADKGWEGHLLRAYLGVVELDRSLDFTAHPRLAESLHHLYLHLLLLLGEALERGAPGEPCERAEGLLGRLRATWNQALQAAA